MFEGFTHTQITLSEAVPDSGITGSSLLSQKNPSGQFELILTGGMAASLTPWGTRSTLNSGGQYTIPKLYMG